MHPLLCFGEKSMYEESREMWLSEFRRIISNKKIQFSIMGFPFKVTNPLKTSRISPDLGEVMAMQRLENIALLLEKVSKRNISIVVISEGGLSKQVGYDSLVAEQYAKYAKKVGKKLGFTHLSFLPLSKMEEMFSDFDLAFKAKAKELTKQFKRGDSGIVEKINGAQPIILRIVKHPNLPLHELMDMYNFRIPTENLSPRIKQARESLGENATKATLEYFAYLALRDESQFLTKELGKNTITLTVSPCQIG
jgi:pyoverdine/dityrosine biosynthesis protein Dit1